MKTIRRQQKQNIIDFVIQEYGSADYLIEFLKLNNINYEDFIFETRVKVDENISNDFLQFKKQRGITVVSGDDEIQFALGDFNKDYNTDYFNQDLLFSNTAETSYWEPFTGSTPTSYDPYTLIDDDFDGSVYSSNWTLDPADIIEDGGIYYVSISRFVVAYRNNIYFKKTGLFEEGSKYSVSIDFKLQTSSPDFKIRATDNIGIGTEDVNQWTITPDGINNQNYTFDFICEQDGKYFEIEDISNTPHILDINRVIVKKIIF